VPFRVRHKPALVRIRLADVAAVEAVVDLGVAILVEVDSVAVTAGIESEHRVGLVKEAAMGVGVGDHGRCRKAQDGGKRQGHVVGHPDVDLIRIVPAWRPDLDGCRDACCGLGDAATV